VARTPNFNVVYEYVKAVYDLPIGVTNCRRIAGSQTFSQHSWSNAGDIYTTNKDLQDVIAINLERVFGDHIRNILTWRYNPAHWNHIHIDMWPRGWLTPPCAGGPLRIKYRDGTISNGPFPLSITEEDEEMTPEQENAVNWLVASLASTSADQPPWGSDKWDDYLTEWSSGPGPYNVVTHIQLAHIYNELKKFIPDSGLSEADFEDIIVRSLKA
jgi:hypothetical protein